MIEVKKNISPHEISSTIRLLKRKSEVLAINKVILITQNKIVNKSEKFKMNNIMTLQDTSNLKDSLFNLLR